MANSSQAPVSAAAVTALHIMPSSRNVIVYIGDAAGWVRAYSKEGIIMAQTKVRQSRMAQSRRGPSKGQQRAMWLGCAMPCCAVPLHAVLCCAVLSALHAGRQKLTRRLSSQLCRA